MLHSEMFVECNFHHYFFSALRINALKYFQDFSGNITSLYVLSN